MTQNVAASPPIAPADIAVDPSPQSWGKKLRAGASSSPAYMTCVLGCGGGEDDGGDGDR
jgi:hypothetical protein